MVYVLKGNREFPFSKGILAKSVASSGVSVEESYEIVNDIRNRFEEENIEKIRSEDLMGMVSEELLRRGNKEEEKFYRVRRKIKYLEDPIFILIGGGSGVGKSSISSEVGHRLGIERVIGSDTIREIMRATVPSNLVPTLHESTFLAGEELRTPYVTNKLIHAFEEHVSLVSEGIVSVLERGEKEGLDMVINGVQIVPGFIESRMKNPPENVFKYVLVVPDKEQHIRHFYSREEGSRRDPNRYIDNIDKIREIQDYIRDLAEKSDVKVVENYDYEETLSTILDDIISSLEKKM